MQKHLVITSFVYAMLVISLILFEYDLREQYDLREVLTRWVPAALGNVVSPFLVHFICRALSVDCPNIHKQLACHVARGASSC